MRHQIKGRKLSREKDQRKALLKSLARSIILKERITTTKAKAKEASVLLEKSITRAKKGDLHSKRLLLKLFSPAVVKKLTEEIGPKYKERSGGYTRILKLGPRKSDSTEMVIIELVK